MADIINFDELFKQKQETEKTRKQKELFQEILAHANKKEIEQIREAIRNLDQTKYLEVTQPIIMRIAIIKFNNGEL